MPNAVDEARKETMTRETHEDWRTAALAMIAKDRNGVLRDLLSYAHEGKALDNPVQVKAAQQGVRLVILTEPNLPARIVSDPNRIRQILINIVGNSIKFTHRGSVELSVKMLPHASSPAYGILSCTISDTGIGMSSKLSGHMCRLRWSSIKPPRAPRRRGRPRCPCARRCPRSSRPRRAP